MKKQLVYIDAEYDENQGLDFLIVRDGYKYGEDLVNEDKPFQVEDADKAIKLARERFEAFKADGVDVTLDNSTGEFYLNN